MVFGSFDAITWAKLVDGHTREAHLLRARLADVTLPIRIPL